MARGMNWGIFSLLVIVAMVLATFVVFFIYLARRSAILNRGRASVLASPDFLGLPQELNLAGPPFLPTRPKPLVKSTRPVP